jgi:hypothetical protein
MDGNGAVTRNSSQVLRSDPTHNGGPPLATAARRRGRPSKFTPELRDRILEKLVEGLPICRICSAPGMPSSETVRCWRRDDPKFARQFDSAQELGWHRLAEELFLRVETACHQGSVARARLIFDTGRWYLARQAPGFFGGGGWR